MNRIHSVGEYQTPQIGKLIRFIISGKYNPRTEDDKRKVISILLATLASTGLDEEMLTCPVGAEQTRKVAFLAKRLDMSPEGVQKLLSIGHENLDLVIEESTKRKAKIRRSNYERFLASLNSVN